VVKGGEINQGKEFKAGPDVYRFLGLVGAKAVELAFNFEQVVTIPPEVQAAFDEEPKLESLKPRPWSEVE